MILEEYDEELHIRNEKEISFNQGVLQGRKQDIVEMLLNGGTDYDLRRFLKATDAEIAEARSTIVSQPI